MTPWLSLISAIATVTTTIAVLLGVVAALRVIRALAEDLRQQGNAQLRHLQQLEDQLQALGTLPVTVERIEDLVLGQRRKAAPSEVS